MLRVVTVHHLYDAHWSCAHCVPIHHFILCNKLRDIELSVPPNMDAIFPSQTEHAQETPYPQAPWASLYGYICIYIYALNKTSRFPLFREGVAWEMTPVLSLPATGNSPGSYILALGCFGFCILQDAKPQFSLVTLWVAKVRATHSHKITSS